MSENDFDKELLSRLLSANLYPVPRTLRVVSWVHNEFIEAKDKEITRLRELLRDAADTLEYVLEDPTVENVYKVHYDEETIKTLREAGGVNDKDGD